MIAPLKVGFSAEVSRLEARLYSKLVHALNQTADVVGEYLAEHFINLRGWQLAPNESAELAFDHVEGSLDV